MSLRPLPPLLKQYLVNISEDSRAAPRQITLGPEILFQSIVKRQILQTTGTQKFGSYGGRWIIQANQFSDTIPELLEFIRFRGAVVNGGSIDAQKIVMMLDSADSVNHNEKDDEFKAVFRDVQLMNCCYDEVL